MKRVMIDIETLGKNPGCVILSIGAVQFGTVRKGEWFYEKISIDDCTRNGLTIDQSTLQWWGEQSPEARREAFSGKQLLNSALYNLSSWIGAGAQVWGNGAAFDLGILRAAYSKIGVNEPWEYSGERYYRTLRDLCPLDVSMSLSDEPLPLVDAPSWYKPDGVVLHNGLFDAALQASKAVYMLKGMGCWE
jgi:hypothetical protein